MEHAIRAAKSYAASSKSRIPQDFQDTMREILDAKQDPGNHFPRASKEVQQEIMRDEIDFNINGSK